MVEKIVWTWFEHNNRFLLFLPFLNDISSLHFFKKPIFIFNSTNIWLSINKGVKNSFLILFYSKNPEPALFIQAERRAESKGYMTAKHKKKVTEWLITFFFHLKFSALFSAILLQLTCGQRKNLFSSIF